MRKGSNQWLFRPHADGHYDLPDDLVQLNTAHSRLEAHTIETATAPQDITDATLDMIDAAMQGAELPTRFDYDDHLREARAVEVAQRAQQLATERIKDDVTSYINGHVEILIADYLRPAYQTVMIEAQASAEKLAGADLTATGMARADAATRKTLLTATDLVTRYAEVRSVWSRLFEKRTLEHPAYLAAFGEARNAAAVWPAVMDLSNLHGFETPWPNSTSLDRMLWMATHPDAEPWLPTPAEYDARVAEVFADRIAALARGRAARGAMDAWGDD